MLLIILVSLNISSNCFWNSSNPSSLYTTCFENILLNPSSPMNFINISYIDLMLLSSSSKSPFWIVWFSNKSLVDEVGFNLFLIVGIIYYYVINTLSSYSRNSSSSFSSILGKFTLDLFKTLLLTSAISLALIEKELI